MDAETLARRWRPMAKALDRREKIGRELAAVRRRSGELRSALPAAQARDREMCGRAAAEGRKRPERLEAERINAEIDETQRLAQDLEAAVEVVDRELGELRSANRHAWSKSQDRAVAQAGSAVLAAARELEVAVAKLEDERGLRAWVAASVDEGTVDPHGGRLTNTGAIATALDVLREAVEGLVAGQDTATPPQREASWVEKRLAALAKPQWG